MAVSPTNLKLLRFADLKEAGIISNWPQLKRMVENHGFPPGYMLSPAVRVWDARSVEEFLEARRNAGRASNCAQDQVAA